MEGVLVKRLQTRAVRRAELFRAKYAAAGGDSLRLLAVAWDDLRAAIKALDPADADTERKQLVAHFRARAQELRKRSR
jgi:hypothetical protein